MFPNFRAVESDYYNRTKIFPIMHVVGIKKSLVERFPWLPATVYKAFCQAKDVAIQEMAEQAVARLTLPWPEVNLQDAKDLMGQNFWRYGIAESVHEIETLVRYSFEQGLAARELDVREIFHPSVFEISRT
ncbi:MAG: hypothetical protein WDN29_09085 [Methylovirgula sp.]